MAKIKLPESLSAWKVASVISDTDEGEIYQLVKKDNEAEKAKLAYYEFSGELYRQDDIDFIKDEADFVSTVKGLGDITNYVDVCVEDNPDKKTMKLYIVTDDSRSLAEQMNSKQFSEDEVVDFGIQMSEILEKLESKNIYHGDIKPSNIFVTPDGKYRLGGFMDAEVLDEDAAFMAPEIAGGTRADYTTDIYSLGLIMSAMSNGGKMPFEGENLSAEEAAEKRLSGETVPVPEHGSQKLKSVIMIACQADNKNRWKNAGNIKNALLSMQNEAEEAPATDTEDVIVPESTDFDGNIFEESAEDTKDATAETAAAAVGAAVVGAAVAGALSEQEAEASGDLEDVTPSYQEPEIDNRVFDDYQNQTKVFSLNQPSGEKDYGSYFDDEEDVKPGKKSVPMEDFDPFADVTPSGEDDKKQNDNKKKRKGLIIAIIVGACVVAALLALLGVISCNSGVFGGDGRNATGDSAATSSTLASGASAAATTATGATGATTKPTQATTAPSATEPRGTEASDTEKATEEPVEYVTVKVVRGYTFEEAKEILEADGLTITEGRHRPSDEYEEGLVIAQTPGDGHSVEKGSNVIVDISTGPETPPATEAEREESSQSSRSSGSDEVPFSSCKYNTEYLSQNEVKNMSQSELNIAFNEIYARRGRIFTSPSLDSYFRSQSWYTPKYTASEFSEKVVFNDYETKNINLIYNEQHARGYR